MLTLYIKLFTKNALNCVLFTAASLFPLISPRRNWIYFNGTFFADNQNVTALLLHAVASNSSALSIMVMSPFPELGSSSGNHFSHL